ncbi:linear amide C-N hydrolase [Shewanella oncorhynchi]|uniref:Linear amide C-N hydrolase n=1 Tax=Shewanella oncorhynchi TaxID=2726434 RepID=A0AA50KA93_9GAMM|nr:linear amide C-N hydrolase [Shewanella oncorhynchi]WMB71240.1 linear amide C-N hydrolase [Shewanella oncorhynchi]
MNHFLVLKRVLVTGIATIAIWLPNFADSCTSLLYRDANGAPYAGRTMELPYEVTYIPNGNFFNSKTNNHSTLSFQAKFSFISLTIPDPINKSLKVVEGLNDQGLSFSVLAFTSTQGPKDMVAKTQKVLAAIDLGAWTLSQFKTVAEVKTALEEQPVLVTALLPLGILNPPFHYALHDTSGSSLAIEFSKGEQKSSKSIELKNSG